MTNYLLARPGQKASQTNFYLALDEVERRLADALELSPSPFEKIYGPSERLKSILESWKSVGIPLHNIIIVPSFAIPGADAAYVLFNDTILISSSFLETASVERIIDVITEELGHRLDASLSRDTPGDEGEALVATLRGEPVPITIEDTIDLSALEFATSVSDSGGFEGSSKMLKLESKSGSTISYTYQHYFIPDRFIIRYEGRNLFDTGFTGGSRSGTVSLPAGNSDEVQVIVATDNAGTAWFYTVTAEPQDCEDIRPWLISADKEFEPKDQSKKCETTGTIYVGRQDGAALLFRAEGTSSAAYQKGLLEVKDGKVFSGIGSIATRLFTGDIDLSLITGIASLSNVKPGDFRLASLPVEFKSMAVLKNKLGFDVRFVMPDAATGLAIETTDFFSQALQIDSNGATPVLGFRIDPPGRKQFKLGGFFDVEASNIAIEYRGAEDALRVQSKVEISFDKASKLAIKKIEADLSGPNYIQVNSDGKVDVIGVLKATRDVGIQGGWSLQELEFNINTTTREVGGAATLGTPFGVKFGESATARAEVEVVYTPIQIDKVGLIIDGLNKPIPAYPAFFFQRIGGSLDNIASSNTKDVEGKFTIGATLGPKIKGTSLALAQYDATVTSKFFEGQMTTDILTADFSLKTPLFSKNLGKFTLVKDVSTSKLDWSKGELSFNGTSNVLDGFFVSSGSFKANSNFDFSFARSGQVALPNFVPVFGGTKLANSNFAINYTNNATSNDDFAAGWGQYNVVTPWDQYNITLGLRINFDGTISRIGAGNIPTTSSWFVPSGQDFVMLTATWEADNQAVKVRVIKPNGSIIEEDDFESNKIAIVEAFTSGSSRTVIIDSPEAGTWDLEIVNPTGLGQIAYEATGAIELPKISFTGIPLINPDGTVNYNFDVKTATSASYLTFYYDSDLTELDGLLAGSIEIGPNESSGKFTWDAAQAVPGSYYLYAMLNDGTNPIVIAQNPNAVSVGSEADLAVSILANADEANPGEKVKFTITVENLSSTSVAKNTRVFLNLPDKVDQIVSNIPQLNPSIFADYEISFGDIKAGGFKDITIETIVDKTAVSGDQFAADVYVLSDIYDSATENNVDAAQFIVPPKPKLPTVDLSVESNIDTISEPTSNNPFSYIIRVSNKGLTRATNVILTESVVGLTDLSSNLASSLNGTDLITSIGDLDVGESIDVEITATAPNAGLVFTTSSVTAEGVDTAITNNEQINIASILGASPDKIDLSLSLAAGINNKSIVVSVQNDGPGIASDVEIKIDLPNSTSVINSSAEQGLFNNSTNIWSVGNVRDNLNRSLTLTVNNLTGEEITAEVIGVNETDIDSIPNDGKGDDFASLFGSVSKPSYTLKSNALELFEGDRVSVGVSSNDVKFGTPIYWSFSGSGIKSSDFVDGLVTGFGAVGDDGRYAFSAVIAADVDSDPDEILEVSLFSDAALTTQIGNSLSIKVKELTTGNPTDGSDLIQGTANNSSITEIISGVPVSSILRGRSSTDYLTGLAGPDTFVLGNIDGAFYNDGIPNQKGSSDLAVILDFGEGDKIQLYGTPGDYKLSKGAYTGGGITNSKGLFISQLAPSSLDETIGFVKGATFDTLSLLNKDQFIYAS